MRGALITTILVCILVLTGATIFAIEGKTTRQNELDANLSSAMDRSMEIMTVDKKYDIENNEQLIADFIQNFLVRLNSNSDVTIDILGVDAEKGLLSVRATETFPSLFGESSVSATRTIILDDYENTEEEYFEVTFYETYEDGKFNDPLKQIHVYGGSTLAHLNPVTPVKTGSVLKGWKMAYEIDGEYYMTEQIYNEEDFENLSVTKNLKFVSVWSDGTGSYQTVIFYNTNNQIHSIKRVENGTIIGSSIEYPEDINGKSFSGWSSSQHGFIDKDEIQNVVITEKTKFTAIYE